MGTASDTGRRRLKNEDAFVSLLPLFAIADGMGGARAGEVASRIATSTLAEQAGLILDAPTLQQAVRIANTRVFHRATSDPETLGMGTTVTAALVDEHRGRITIGHVGDSRAYRLRGGVLEQLTPDHSLVGELVREGRLTPEQAESHPHKAVITRVVGTEADVEVDTLEAELQPGDLYLLCSDGLTDMVRDVDIESIVAGFDGDPQQVANALVSAANANGGEDNITVIAFEIVDEPAGDRVAPTATPAPSREDAVPRRRFGAAAGSRWPALLALAAGGGLTALVVVWSLVR